MEQKKYEEFKGKPRLPKFAVPKSYDLRLKLDLDACKFTGAVEISIDVVADTKFLILNAAELTIDRKSVRFRSQCGSKVLEALEVELLEDDEIMVVEFSEVLPVGVGLLCIAFNGIINDQMRGFYQSTYEHEGETKNMAVTQFEPADARRCFPCWDEPACKATFKVRLEVPSELVALSNMPVVEETVSGNLKTVHYAESPVMSTYLVAFVVGLLEYIEDHTSDGIKVRVYCQVGKGNQGKVALDVAIKLLGFYAEYFAMPYPLPKLDMVAIPDFAMGAMENYGLVTYRDVALLYDDKHSEASMKQGIVGTVAHELSHQWFGNLVTMEWWTHLWLNEGFATWVSILATDRFFPEWKIWNQFLNDINGALQADGLSESHPIEVEINHASEIQEIFDEITYWKGASIVWMLQSYLGPECFQRAFAAYIKKYACSNAKTEDLWAVLEDESGEPVKKLMNSWTKQKGFPVVSAKLKDKRLELEQLQFSLSGFHGDGLWIVPITLCCGSYDARQKLLLQTKSVAVDVPEMSRNGSDVNENSSECMWIKLNVYQTGFYRVKYDEDLSAGLKHAIERKCLSAADRVGILDDSDALCMACQQSLTSLLTLMSAYREETDHTVLLKLTQISSRVARFAADASPEVVDCLRHYFISLFEYSAGRLGWDLKEGESDLDTMLRGEILTSLARFGHEMTLNEARKRFHAFLDDRNTPLLPPDLRRTTYFSVMRNVSTSDRSDFDSLLRVYRETNLSEEKTRILGSFRGCRDPEIILEILSFMLSSEVRSQDVIELRVGRDGREVAWKWFKDNWDQILRIWGAGFLISTIIRSIVSPFSSMEKVREVEEFFATRTIPSITRTLKQSIERVHINAKWVQSIQNEKHLAQFVQELARSSQS